MYLLRSVLVVNILTLVQLTYFGSGMVLSGNKWDVCYPDQHNEGANLREGSIQRSWHESWTSYPLGSKYSLEGDVVDYPEHVSLDRYGGHAYATRATCYSVLGGTSPNSSERTYEYNGGNLRTGKRFRPFNSHNGTDVEPDAHTRAPSGSVTNNLIVFYQITKYTYSNQKSTSEIAAHIYDQIISGAFKSHDYFTVVYGPYPDKAGSGSQTLRFKVMNILDACLALSDEQLTRASKKSGILGIMDDDKENLGGVWNSKYTSFTALKEFLKSIYVATHESYYKCGQDDCTLLMPNIKGNIDDIETVAEKSQEKWHLEDYPSEVPRYTGIKNFHTINRATRNVLRFLFGGESEVNKYVLMIADPISDIVRYTESSKERYAHRSCDRIQLCRPRPRLYKKLEKLSKENIFYMKKFPDAVENAIMKDVQMRRSGHELKETKISQGTSTEKIIIDGKINLGTPDSRIQGDLDPKLDRLYFSYYLMNLNPSYFTTVSVLKDYSPIAYSPPYSRQKHWDYVALEGNKADSMFNCMGTLFISKFLYGSPMICGDDKSCKRYRKAINLHSYTLLLRGSEQDDDKTKSAIRDFAEEQAINCSPFSRLNEKQDFAMQLMELSNVKIPDSALEDGELGKEHGNNSGQSLLSIEPRLGASAVMLQYVQSLPIDLANISTFPDEYALIYNALYYYSYLPHHSKNKNGEESVCRSSREEAAERSLAFLNSKNGYLRKGFEIIRDFFHVNCKDICALKSDEMRSGPDIPPLCFSGGGILNTTNHITSGKYIWYSSPLCAAEEFRFYSYYMDHVRSLPQRTSIGCVFNEKIAYWKDTGKVVDAPLRAH